MDADECILYSDSLACVSSVIPAFAKKGDTIIVDDCIGFSAQQGCLLSRSTVYYFEHGNMASLEKVLKEVDAKHQQQAKKGAKTLTHRKFIVIEGVSSVYGDIVPLDRVLELKKKYAYRLIMDDSLGFGVLGATGKGTIEHFSKGMQQAGEDAPAGVDLMCASMDGAISSVGGFCVGNHQVIDHQRLSGAGYCFSASSPPYTSTASIETLAVMADQPALCAGLRKKAQKLRRSLATSLTDFVVLGGSQSDESPVIHLAKRNHSIATRDQEQAFVERVLDHLASSSKIIASVPEFIPADRTRATPTIRIAITVLHTEADFEKLIKAINAAAATANKKIKA